jgi:hypothetical protein
MFKKFSFLFLFIIFLSITNCNALVWEDLYPGHINNGNGYLVWDDGNTNDYIIVDTNEDEILLCDYADSALYTLMMHSPEHEIYSAYVASNGHLYYTTSLGIYMRKDTSTNSYYTNQTEFETGKVDTIANHESHRMREENGYIYLDDFDANVYKRINLNNNLESIYFTPSTFEISVATNDRWTDFDIYNGNIYTLVIESAYVKVYKNDELIYNVDALRGSNFGHIGGIQVIDSDKIYLHAAARQSDGDYFNYAYIIDDTGNLLDTWSFDLLMFPNGGTIFGDFYIGSKENTIAYANFYDVNIVEVQDTGRQIGGGAGSQWSYLQTNINSMYDTYYNNSKLQAIYNIRTDVINNSEADDFTDNIYYRVDLINPDGVNLDSKLFYASEFTQDNTNVLNFLFDYGQAYYYSSGTIRFSSSSDWLNGTYTLRMYEIDRSTNNILQLDFDTFEVLPEQIEGLQESEDFEENMPIQSIAQKYISSSYTWGAGIALTIGGVGAVFAGPIGFLLGLFLGLIICVGIGLLPSWIILAIIILAAFILTFMRTGDM